MPKVRVFPVCSACMTPFILRRAMDLTPPKARAVWIWQRDCKHKKAVPLTSAALERAARQDRKAKEPRQ